MAKKKLKVNVIEQTQTGADKTKMALEVKTYKPRGRPFEKGNTVGNRFKSKAELNGQRDPRINATGRPRMVGDAYQAVLQSTYDIKFMNEDERERVLVYTGNENQDITYAEKIALMVSTAAALGDISAAREIRTTLEGDKLALQTWQIEVLDALRRKDITPEQVIEQFGFDDAEPILIAAGVVVVPELSRTQERDTDTTSDDIARMDTNAP